NLFLNIRNTNEYNFNNIFLIVSMNFPHGKTITDTLEYRMANPDGSWMGQGIGNVKENKLWYKENVQFFEDGIYTVTIGQAMRNNGAVEGVTKLEGITDVGFSVEEATKQENKATKKTAPKNPKKKTQNGVSHHIKTFWKVFAGFI